TVAGNFWGGKNNETNITLPLEGKDYALEMTFSGNSTFAVQNEWWVGMSAKVNILIEDNAHVSAGSGNSGIGWAPNASGSLVTMTGGNLTVNTWNVQSGTMNVGGNALFKTNADLNLDKGDSYLTLSDDAVIRVNGTTRIGNNSDYTGNFTQTGGYFFANGTTFFSYHANGNVDISGGKFISNSAQLYVTDQNGRTANIKMSGNGYLQAKDLRLSQHGNTNLTMSGNSSILTNIFSAAFNYSNGDNVTNVNTIGESASVTTGRMTFFGGNAEQGHTGAGYGSLTLNDNAKVTVAADTLVGAGAGAGILDGKENSAEITLNGNSTFTTGTFIAAYGTKSLTNVNDSATFNATTIDISYDSTFNLNSGTINLRPYGYIKATEGTFNANGGAINFSASDKVSYTAGDQMIVGLYNTQEAADAANALTHAPAGWQTSVVNVNGQYAVVAGYGSAPTGVKYWQYGYWNGDTGNNTGFIIDGTNDINSYDNQMVVLGGTNTFTNTIPSNTTLVFSGGTSTQDGTIEGSVFVNGGTLTVSGGNRNVKGYLEINGGAFNATNSFWNENKIVVNSGTFTVGGSYLPMRYSSDLEVNGGQVTISRLMICDNEGAYTGSFVQNGGNTLFTGNVDVAQKPSTTGSFIVNGGVLACNGSIILATPDNSTAVMEVNGGDVTAARIIVGRVDAGDNAVLRVTGGTLRITQDLCGSGGSPSGKTFISGTGQMLFDSTYTDMAIIREQTYIGIEGSGADGNGAMRFLQSADSTSPITLTGNATIGIQGGQTLTMKAPINSESSNYVLTVKGGTVDLTSSEVSTVKNIALQGAYLNVNNLNFNGNVYGDDKSRVVFTGWDTDDTFNGTTLQAGAVIFDGSYMELSQNNLKLSAAENITVKNGSLVWSYGNNAAISAQTIEAKNAYLIVDGDNSTVTANRISSNGDSEIFFASNNGSVTASEGLDVSGGAVVLWGSTTAQTPSVTLGSNGQVAVLYVGENASLAINGPFVPSSYTTGAGASEFVVTDNAKVTVNGNFWGGTNVVSSVVPLDGYDFVLYQYYGGNSQFTSNEWWAAMSVKTYISISDNASVTSTSGNSGLGQNVGSYGSVLDMTGGTLSVATMYNNGSTMNFSGNSVTTVSGNWISNQAENFTSVSDKATLNINGSLYLGNDAGLSTFNQSGGLTTVGGNMFFSYHGDANVNISGGSFYANNTYLYITDQKNRVANIKLSGDSYLKANNFRTSQHGYTFMDVSGNAVLDIGEFNLAYNCDNGDNVEAYVAMSGDSVLRASQFYSFKGNNDNNHSGAAYASFSMTDNAKAYITGNAWGGSDDGDNVAALVSGKDYNLDMSFGGDSYFSASEFWMAMAGKVHITVKDNAKVVARSGSSGLGWSENTDSSLLEIAGGTVSISADSFFIGHDSTNYG
ncbi:MAG: hypothetical protein IKW80_10645, partial [Thermoguttaceae bacterium]|nr:hypothetical protein [Thermoguttaceae bacterium]